MSVDTKLSIAKSAKNFFIGTILSRVFGMLRDVSMAIFFGSSPHIAAFFVAYRFSNLFRRLFGEGTLNSIFIPHFEAIRQIDNKKAAYFYRDLFFSIVTILLFIVIIIESGLFFWIKFQINENTKEIIYLISIMLPGLVFICLYALNNALLQCHKRYFLPAAAPTLFNIIWIVCAVLFKDQLPKTAMIALSFGVIIAYLVQWLLTVPSSFTNLEKLDYKEWLRPKIFSEEIKKILKPFFFAILGIGAVQINSALDPIFGRIADIKGPAYLWYAMRLYQIPFTLFGIAISSALLPPLARAYKQDNIDRFKEFLNTSIVRNMLLMIPCSIGILVLGSLAINLIFGRGNFDQTSTVNTAQCLWGYVLGLFPSSLVLILASGFYAKKKYFVPAVSSISSVGLNILLNAAFIFILNWKTISVAVATSLSSFLNAYILYRFLKNEHQNLFEKKNIISFFKITVCSLVALFFVIIVGLYLKEPSVYLLLNLKPYVFPRSFMIQLSSFLVYFIVYVSTFLIAAYFMKVKDIINLLKKTSTSS